jgi:hypothetical protein
MRISTERVYWSYPDDVYALTDAEWRPGLTSRLVPEGMRSLVGTGPLVERLHTVMMVVHDEDGAPIGMETELEVLPRPDEPQLMEVFLTLSLPGRGSLFVRELKLFGEPHRDKIWEEVKATGNPWTGELKTTLSVGPGGENNRGVVLAGTGEFEGATGTQYQTSTIREIRPDGWENHLCETFDLTWAK